MAKSALFVLSVLVLVAATYATVALPPLCSGTATKCKAKASLKLFVVGRGKCTGRSAAHCNAIAKATLPCFDIEEAEIENKFCFKKDIGVYASCTARAFAAVWTRTNSYVSCNGKKTFGCAWARAEGKAFACSYALSLATLLVKIGKHQAGCEAAVGALTEVVAAAASVSASDVCVKNSASSDFDKDSARALEYAITKAYAKCWINCDGSSANVVVDGAAEVIIKNLIKTAGDGGSASVGDGH